MDDYTKAYTEVLYIINNLEEDIKSKIPNEFMDFLKSKMNLKYAPIDENSISEEAKAILSVVYSEYLCSGEEKEKWDNLDGLYQKSISISAKQKAKQPELYHKEKETEEKSDNKEIMIVEENSKLTKILKNIKKFFKSIWRK